MPGKQLGPVLAYLGRKTLQMLVTLLLILLLTFVVFYLIPGDPARIMLGTNADAAKVAQLTAELGLDKPWYQQVGGYLSDLLRGDLGTSLRFALPVAGLLGSRIQLTLALSLEALLLAVLIGIPLAIASAHKPGGALDQAISLLVETWLAIPPFFMGILLTLMLGVVFRQFEGVSYVTPQASLPGFFRSLLLPALAIALPRVAWVVQFLRQALIDEQGKDYVRTAVGKGLSRGQIIRRHLIRNALVPLITTLGVILAELLAGAIIIEQVYNLPGLGRLLVTAIEARDFPLAQGIILFIALVVVLVNFTVDLVNQFIDPRLRSSYQGKPGVLV